MKLSKTKYLAMPVTPAEKRALNAQGYKVVDVRFAPAGYEEETPKPKRSGKKKQAE